MNRPKQVFSFLILFIFAGVSFAQGDARQVIEPSYDVMLQIVIGGDDKASGQPMPQNLANVAKQLRATYPFADYRLVNTYVGRIAVGGNFEYKSISNVFGQSQQSDTPSFWEWTLSGLRAAQSGTSRELSLNGFRFGARIPVRTGNFKDETGKPQPVFNYESIGLNSMRVTLAESTPTLIGSLALPNTTGTVFLVLTLRPA